VFENSSVASGNTVNVTWTHTVGTGAGEELIVGVSIRNGDKSVTALTFNGIALTRLGFNGTSNGAPRMEMWHLTDPPPGAHSIVLKTSSADDLVAGAVSFRGVASLGTFVSSSGTTVTGLLFQPSVSGLPTTSGVVLVDTLADNFSGGVATPGSGQTARWNTNPTNTINGAGSTAPASAAGGSMDWTIGGVLTSGVDWTLGAVSLNPLAPPQCL